MFGLMRKSRLRAYIDAEIEYWREVVEEGGGAERDIATGITVSLQSQRMAFFGAMKDPRPEHRDAVQQARAIVRAAYDRVDAGREDTS